MTTVFIVLMFLLNFYIFFTLDRIYEINCHIRELDEDIAGIDEEIKALYEKIIESLAEEEGVQG